MKYLSFLLIAIAICSMAVAQSASVSNNAPHKSIYDFKIKSLTGGTIDFSQYKGKKILIVNTASKCGFTPQYKGLEELYKANNDKLVIVGFPSDNFAGQEFQ
jgi:glutathione peroxidase